jgi:diaminohydroxyphosphoribosylaminopyrimidine deaminase/5-amino-6-(5-phosphoribosylamino)uracil reductase
MVVTLEPCNHFGRTPPCTQAIVNSGISQVVYAQPDVAANSAGGALALRNSGIPTIELEPTSATRAMAQELIRPWQHATTVGRPYVIAKFAVTLDGKVAASDGSSHWITGAAAREHAHLVRSQVGAILVTTGTVLADNPALTARFTKVHSGQQPLIVIVGKRHLPPDSKVYQSPGGYRQIRTHDVHEVLQALHELQIRKVLIEGGPALITTALRLEVVDEVHAYIAPTILGTGRSAVGDLGITTLSEAFQFTTTKLCRLGNDTLIIATKEKR